MITVHSRATKRARETQPPCRNTPQLSRYSTPASLSLANARTRSLPFRTEKTVEQQSRSPFFATVTRYRTTMIGKYATEMSACEVARRSRHHGINFAAIAILLVCERVSVRPVGAPPHHLVAFLPWRLFNSVLTSAPAAAHA